MRARSQPEVASIAEAHALLGLTGPTAEPVLTAAFRAAVKAAHPSAPGGDADRFRRVIAAWRLIQSHEARPLALAAPIAPPPSPPVLAIGPIEALNGGHVAVRLAGRTLNIHVPKGLRSGEHLRLRGAGGGGADVYLPVLIRGAEGLSVLGDDLYMDCPVPNRLMEDGGRLEIDTHAGARSAWITAGQAPLRLRLKGLGLPARGGRPQGHLFINLQPSDDAPSAAEDLLVRFTRVWTPDRLAA
ncbi:DnaJ C-terminal domain-containing protein [Brevundimonas sp.]|uniref:DnaJ C-terminal domain-containing protein n=1 Tax=Brevundimonas sp. TaxID=1871086 RepID=UPI002D70580B|nr:DnaJ C-terminal domain-containing protein [Brevundimonas sp.]HYC96928.1 DnaJ C-terminal domain-containing protein [Brevundimonas sp.]